MIAPLDPATRLDVEEAAAYLGLSRKTLDNYRSAGVGPDYYKTGRVQYRVADLEDWLERNRVTV